MMKVAQYKTKVFNWRLSESVQHKHNKLISGVVIVAGKMVRMVIITRVCYQ